MRIIFTYIALLAFLGQSYAANIKKPVRPDLKINITHIVPKTYDVQPKQDSRFDRMKNVTVNTIVLEDRNAPTDPQEFEIYKYKKIKEEKLNKIKGLRSTINKIHMSKRARKKALEESQITEDQFNMRVDRSRADIDTINKDIRNIKKEIPNLDCAINYLEHPEDFE